MGLLSYIFNSSYRDGFNGSERFADQEITDEDINRKFDDLDNNRSWDYQRGFNDAVEEYAHERGSTFFMRVLFGK